MSIHINDIVELLEQNPIHSYNGNIQSLLRLLYSAYSEYNVTNSPEARELFRSMDKHMEKLEYQEAECLNSNFMEICMNLEEIAFGHGILVGMYLMTEINGLP